MDSNPDLDGKRKRESTDNDVDQVRICYTGVYTCCRSCERVVGLVSLIFRGRNVDLLLGDLLLVLWKRRSEVGQGPLVS